MLTFQILDGGESYYRPLEPRSTTVGSDQDVDIRLHEAGVAALHARIEPEGETCRITAAEGEVSVNGVEVKTACLDIGDRVEIGGAVLVLGQRVKRPATADDLLVSSSAPRRTFRNDRSPAVKRMFVVVLLIGAVVCAMLVHYAELGSNGRLTTADREVVVNARKRGAFEVAIERLDALETEWAKSNSERLSVIAHHRDQIAATTRDLEALSERLMAEVATRTKSDQIDELKELRKDPAQSWSMREAASIIGSSLTDRRIAAERLLDGASGASQIDDGPGGPGKTGRDRKTEPAVEPEWLAGRLDEIREQREKKKNFVQAWEMARQALPRVPSKFAGPLLDELSKIRLEARTEMRSLVARARAKRDAGRLKEGVDLLQAESRRFPATGEMSLLYRELTSLSAELGVAMAPRKVTVVSPIRMRTPAQDSHPSAHPNGRAEEAANGSDTGFVDPPEDESDRSYRGRLDTSRITTVIQAVRVDERAGEFAKAIDHLDSEASDTVTYGPRVVTFLRDWQTDLTLIRDMAAAVQANSAAVAAAGPVIKLADGRRVKITSADATRLVGTAQGQAVSEGQIVRVAWFDLPVASATAVATAAGLSAESRIGVGVLTFRRGEHDAAEAYLAGLLVEDTGLLGKVSVVVARSRGERLDEAGYAVVEDRFVARRFLKVGKLASTFSRQIDRMLKMTDAQRGEALNTLRESSEPGADDALTLALRNQLERMIDKFARSSIRKVLAKLEKKRVAIDKARDHARSLIYDTVKYFYPYKPPAVSGARYGEYMVVQKEVDKRVAALRKLWLDKSTKVSISGTLRRDLDFTLWVETQLSLMSEPTDRIIARAEWVRSIPPVAIVTVRSYCRDAAERDRFVHNQKIEILNEELSEDLNEGEVTLVEITNSYRMMFGHRPLAVSPKLHKSTRGHAEEMSRMGYFSHTSPVEDHRTPFMRMRNEDYEFGVSENIATSGAAEGAHIRWLHSSGHHRNLLRPSHTEFGAGNSGRYWVQNFGRGREYLDADGFK